MAKIRDEEELKRFEAMEMQDHNEIMEKTIRSNNELNEKRVQKILVLMDKAHKVGLIHKIKEKIFKKECEICKALRELK